LNNLTKAIFHIILGSFLLAAGVLIILFFWDFTPRYIGGAIIAAFGAALITSGIIGCAKT